MQQLAPSPSQQCIPSHGLMSLCDMIRRYAKEFVLLAHIIKKLEQFEPRMGNALSPSYVGTDKQLREELKALWPGLVKLTDTIPLPMVEPHLRRIKAHRSRGSSADSIRRLMEELHNRLHDDLNSQWFFHVGSGDVEFYQSPTPLGELGSEFVDAAEDLELAGKRFALQQPTASVFHVSRGLEVIVGCLTTHVGIPNPNREWGKLLSDLDDKIKGLAKNTDEEKAFKKRWSEVRANLWHLKEAWRNETMHPRKHYLQPQAKEILDATRVFIRGLRPMIADEKAS